MRKWIVVAGAGMSLLALAHFITLPLPTVAEWPAPGWPTVEEAPAEISTLPKVGRAVAPGTSATLGTILAEYGLDRLNAEIAAEPVPPLFITRLPTDLAAVTDLDRRKRLFVHAVLPSVLLANEFILLQRARLEKIHDETVNGLVISEQDQIFLRLISKQYHANPLDFEELLRRVDAVPPSLALAQAAAESGWGTSRFAREGNALFGQWTWQPGAGIVPMHRPEGATHSVKAFGTVFDSVIGYMRNLNQHDAYQRFRLVREDNREAGPPLDGWALAATLTKYSERGAVYTEELQALIESNDLTVFDDATLARRLPPLSLADARDRP